jgi:hypothetical protein
MGSISDDTHHHAVPKRLTVLEGVQTATTTEFINYSARLFFINRGDF